MEDAVGRSSRVPEEPAPCRGPGPSPVAGVDGLPPVAAAVSAARRGGRPGGRETHDDGDDPACLRGVHAVAGTAPLRPSCTPDRVDAPPAAGPAPVTLPDPGSIPGPEVTPLAAIAQQRRLVGATSPR